MDEKPKQKKSGEGQRLDHGDQGICLDERAQEQPKDKDRARGRRLNDDD